MTRERTASDAPAAVLLRRACIVGARTDLLDRPFAAARPVMTLYPHAPVTLLDVRGDFAFIETPAGRRGYVAREAIRDSDALPAVPTRHGAPDAPPRDLDARLAAMGAPAWSPAGMAAGGSAAAIATESPFTQAVARAAEVLAPVLARAVREIRAVPRRTYLVAGAMVLAAVILLLLGHRSGGEEGRVTAATHSGAASAGSGIAATDGSAGAVMPEITAPAEGAELTAPVRIDVQLPNVTLKLPSAGDPQARHLHYFVDMDPAAVLGPGQPVPSGIPGIFHSDATSLTLDLAPGVHSVWVVLTDNDHVPLAGSGNPRVGFTVVSPPRSGEQAPLVYQSLVDGRWQLYTHDGDETQARLLSAGAWDDVDPAWSTDGMRPAFASNRDGGLHLYALDADGRPRQLTSGPFQDRAPAWSPDGRWIAFSSDRDGGRDQVFILAADGGEARQLTTGPGGGAQPAWAPDGVRFAFVRVQDGVSHVYAGDTYGGQPQQLTGGTQRQIDPAWSPDGRQIAFAALQDNRWNIYVMNADGSGVRRVTNDEFDRHPAWSPDGRELAFASGREGAQQIFAVDLKTGYLRRLTDGTLHSINPAWPRR